MKKNQAREFVCKVKRRWDYYLSISKESYKIDLGFGVSNIKAEHLKLQKLGLVDIKEDKHSRFYPYRVIPIIRNCLLFLYKYQSLDRNIYNNDWTKK